ncbi:MAG: diguanylate cyclase [Halieaceae bacterium]|jgi:diguanylate cyclase (GGDEF)-like protein|nr:diguanylate cyclase [Halieaceae bacterium]
MERVLLVEDAKFFGSMIEKRLRNSMGLDVVWCETLKETRAALETSSDFTLALLDLTLPDASDTDVVELVRGYNIPSLVFSSTYERQIRDEVMRLGVIDYVIKESPASLNYLFAAINRVLLNRSRQVLVAEDNEAVRKILVDTLERFQLQVIAAADGEKALELFKTNPQVSLVVTDFEMPKMNGLELTKALHRDAADRRFSIIGLSAVTDADLRIQFIKAGAADFLMKPFEIEELFCRISQNLNILDQLELLHHQANNDFLTGIYNRRYFFETGRTKLAQAARSGETCAIVMLDIDNFKAINDTYGHDAGDHVLIEIADRLNVSTRRSDLLARLGGEEFCKLLIAPSIEGLRKIAKELLNAIAYQPVLLNDDEIPVTATIGIAYSKTADLDELIEHADALLYSGKNNGRNRAVMAPLRDGAIPEVVEGPADIEKPYLQAALSKHPEMWR